MPGIVVGGIGGIAPAIQQAAEEERGRDAVEARHQPSELEKAQPRTAPEGMPHGAYRTSAAGTMAPAKPAFDTSEQSDAGQHGSPTPSPRLRKGVITTAKEPTGAPFNAR